jgi:hypothetical protein
MKKFYSEYSGLLISLLLVLVLLNGCGMGVTDAMKPGVVNVTSLQVGGTLNGMKQVISEEVGTFIMAKDNLYSLFWVRPGEGFYFIVLDVQKQTSLKNFIEMTGGKATGIKSYTTFYDFKEALTQAGWRTATVKDLPAALVAAISATGSWVSVMAGSMTTFVFIPVFCDSSVIPEANPCGYNAQPTKKPIT